MIEPSALRIPCLDKWSYWSTIVLQQMQEFGNGILPLFIHYAVVIRRNLSTVETTSSGGTDYHKAAKDHGYGI